MDLFYALTTITIGNGERMPFWDAPWLSGKKPIDVAPLIYKISKRKSWKVSRALHDDAWIKAIDMHCELTWNHVTQFIELWSLLSHINISQDVHDTIIWKLSPNGEYSAKSAYKAQFMGAILTPMNKVIWKVWAPPKVKFFAWLAIQNRVWTTDRLERRGMQNCGLCPLCKREFESAAHLFYRCRYTMRLGRLIRDWLQIGDINTNQWAAHHSLSSWWTHMARRSKAMATLTLLTTWTIWNERNARVFQKKSTPPQIILRNLKEEARLWVLAGSKRLSNLMPRE